MYSPHTRGEEGPIRLGVCAPRVGVGDYPGRGSWTHLKGSSAAAADIRGRKAETVAKEIALIPEFKDFVAAVALPQLARIGDAIAANDTARAQDLLKKLVKAGQQLKKQL